uniref:Uncharacterized protein n=1 Tax=Bionectria ochroleuca TaxID=29856 RepID=A0A8H7TNB6_BIOOC
MWETTKVGWDIEPNRYIRGQSEWNLTQPRAQTTRTASTMWPNPNTVLDESRRTTLDGCSTNSLTVKFAGFEGCGEGQPKEKLNSSCEVVIANRRTPTSQTSSFAVSPRSLVSSILS